MPDTTITPTVGGVSYFPQWPVQPATPDQAFRSAMGNPMVPKIYANSFTNFIGASEVAVMLGIHGAFAGVLSLSYPVAKALAARLTEAVNQYQEKTGITVGELEELERAITQNETPP